jgi:beta-phosphoglucomutase
MMHILKSDNNIEGRRGIIFDMDGVLVDAMPFHCKAIQAAAKQEANIGIDERDIYLLEGMPGEDMVRELLIQKRYTGTIKGVSDEGDDKETGKVDHMAHQIHERKKKIFEQNNDSQPIPGAKELVQSIKCKKALVSGAAKQEVDSIINKYFGKDAFEIIVTGDDIEQGKPNPEPFQTALEKMGLRESEAIVVENAPLGVKSAKRAGISCMVTLNNTPLKIADFENLIMHELIFPNTRSAISYVKEYCQNISSI